MNEAQEFWKNLESMKYFGNSLQDYLSCAGFIVVGILVLKIVDILALRWLKRLTSKSASTLDDFVIDEVESHLLPALYVVIIATGLKDLNLAASLQKGVHVVATVVVSGYLVRLCLAVAERVLGGYLKRRGAEDDSDEIRARSARSLMVIVKLIVWILALVLVLDNLGIEVSAFIAGLGVTGIAVALAAQTVLGDLFSYFVIFFDQPFKVGSFIKVGDFLGTVESIGIKTTRLRSLSGEMIVMSNKHLTDSEVQNFKQMARRRIVHLFEVEYGTPDAKLRELPGVVKGILEGIGGLTFDRCHFKEFGGSGLVYETVYIVEVPDYNAHMDVLQELNFQLKAACEERGISFAFPKRTVHLFHENVPPAAETPAQG